LVADFGVEEESGADAVLGVVRGVDEISCALALLVAVGSRVSWRTEAVEVSAPTVVEEIAQPFGASVPLGAVRESAPARTNPVPGLLLLIWAAGFVSVGIRWGRRWTRMNADARKARAIEMGLPIPVRSSAMLREPGVFGVFRPVLLLPEGITNRLTGAQLDAIVAHEMCHVRRRDNLMTSMHMVVEAVFWFHPLVWWIGARLIEERERACDEEVLRAGNDAQTYAEGILKVCEFYLKSPLECVAGVAGGSLNKRIEDIMGNRVARGLSVGKKMLLACAGMLAVAGPVAIGIVNAPRIQAQAQLDAAPLEFEVASIRPKPLEGASYHPGFSISGIRVTLSGPLKDLVMTAYNVKEYQVSGEPAWSELFEIAAKAPGESAPTMQQARRMLQTLLAERFQLKLHRERKEFPVYELVVAKGGPKLKESAPETEFGISAHDAYGFPTYEMAFSKSSMATLVLQCSYYPLQGSIDRPCLDKTGLTGKYDFKLDWAQPGAQADAPDGPSIFAAMREQIELNLEPAKAAIDALVIEHVEKPTEN
jgi:uncharacterized protein (TIGR03435 family)